MQPGTGTEDVTKEPDDGVEACVNDEESGLIILFKNHLFVYRI